MKSAGEVESKQQIGYLTCMRSHEFIDERSLALAQLVADKLERDPSLLETARANLTRWVAANGGRPQPAYAEWLELIDRLPLTAILGILRTDSENNRRLRQSSPFAGILTHEERWRILRSYEARAA